MDAHFFAISISKSFYLFNILFMYRFSEFPAWIIIIFSLFCLSQVRSWFEEIVESFKEDETGFMYRGRRFAILPNRSFIIDESLHVYGINLKCKHQLN
jgi:hypothetical protein